jgi:hypothetical protein
LIAGLDRPATAALLGVTERTVRNWEARRAKVPYSAFKLLRILSGYALPGAAWRGWSIRGDTLWSPTGRGFEAASMGYLSLVFAMAQQWQRERRSAERSRASGAAPGLVPLLDTCPVLTARGEALDVKSGHGSATGCGLDAVPCREASLTAKLGFPAPAQPLLFDPRRAASPRPVTRGER